MSRFAIMISCLLYGACNKPKPRSPQAAPDKSAKEAAAPEVSQADIQPKPAAPYNRLQQKSVHNAYQRNETLSEQFERYGLRSVELDIHPSRKGETARKGDWFVYHNDDDKKTSVKWLSEGLDLIKKEADQKRDVLTLWLDLKAGFKAMEGYAIEDLDQLMRDRLGPALFTPADLLASCSDAKTLDDFVKICGWPRQDELKGRILVVLTGAPIQDYVRSPSEALIRLGFIAPEISKAIEIPSFPHVLFFNLSRDTAMGTDLPDLIHTQKRMSRTWDINSEGDWKKLKLKPLHHIATNKVSTEKDPWAITKDDDNAFHILP